MTTPEYIEHTPELAARVNALVPFGDHRPGWDTADCPSCGSAPCGPHQTALFCIHCGDPYPCGPVQEVAAELVRLGSIRDHVAQVARVWLEMRAAELLLAPAPQSSTEDTPAHVHTDACMCDMLPMEVVGGYECTHCGGHAGGPCGSLCEVAYDEITATPPVPEPRVWREGDPEPDESVRALAQAEGASLPFLVRAGRGGWFFTVVATSTTDGLGLPWSKALAAARTPLSEVPARGDR